jgi:multidrug efflux pump subunit AcrB
MSSPLNPIVFAMRHPVAVMAGVFALAIGSGLALKRMAIDIFPTLDLPVIYIAQPYNGMTAAQMESMIIGPVEGHSLYIGGIKTIESKNIHNITLVKLHFHPGTNMAQAMAETVGYVNRASFYQPVGTAPPYVARFDTGSVPVGYLVLESDTPRTMSEMQDLALQRVRTIFGSLPGVSAPPPMGGNLRTIVLNVDPDRLRSYNFAPDDVIAALSRGNVVSPAGTVRIHDQMPVVPTNAMVPRKEDIGSIPVKPGSNVHLRDLGVIADASDTTAGYALVNGKRTVFLMVTKRAEASTLAVVQAVKDALPRMQDALPEDVHIRFEFDQSPYVTRAMWGVGTEAALGAILTGLMVLLFLRDWRSVIVVVLNIPLAVMGAVLGLWVTGNTVNIMTLGGIALAIGILVDEATVEVENIHTQMEHTDSVAVAVRRGNAETAVPRLLAMLCILAVFIPMFAMEGAVRNMFVPLALAVGFAMITSYILSSTFVPVVAVWLLKQHSTAKHTAQGFVLREWVLLVYGRFMEWLVARRRLVVGGYVLASATVLALALPQLGTEIFPNVDTGQFQMRLRAPTGTRIERTEELAREATRLVAEAAGPGAVEATVGYVGTTPTNYSNHCIYLWTAGPEEAVLRIALHHGSGVRLEALKHRLRDEVPKKLGEWLAGKLRTEGVGPEEIARRVARMRVSFEPADIVNEVMSFGSPTPVEVVVYGPNLKGNLDYAAGLHAELATVPGLVDLQIAQAQDYPTVDVKIDREKAGRSGVTVQDASTALLAATTSSRLLMPSYWSDTASGFSYQVQVQVPPPRMDTVQEVGMIPVKSKAGGGSVLLRDVADVTEGTTPGQIDRLNLRRAVSLIANVEGRDLGRVTADVRRAVARAGELPRGSRVELRGQVEPMGQMFGGLTSGLALAVIAIAVMLTAYFQSLRLALVSVAAVPAVLAGVAVALLATHTTLNIQSFMGAIMAVGVAVANAILLTTFAEKRRVEGAEAGAAAVDGARRRLRPILMTSLAMLAGMVPMALAWGEGGEQTAPLGRAVIGGLLAALATTLVVLPAVFAVVQGRSPRTSVSLDPADPDSPHYRPEAAAAF